MFAWPPFLASRSSACPRPTSPTHPSSLHKHIHSACTSYVPRSGVVSDPSTPHQGLQKQRCLSGRRFLACPCSTQQGSPPPDVLPGTQQDDPPPPLKHHARGPQKSQGAIQRRPAVTSFDARAGAVTRRQTRHSGLLHRHRLRCSCGRRSSPLRVSGNQQHAHNARACFAARMGAVLSTTPALLRRPPLQPPESMQRHPVSVISRVGAVPCPLSLLWHPRPVLRRICGFYRPAMRRFALPRLHEHRGLCGRYSMASVCRGTEHTSWALECSAGASCYEGQPLMPMFLHNVCPLLHITCSPQCLCTASNPHLHSAELHALCCRNISRRLGTSEAAAATHK